MFVTQEQLLQTACQWKSRCGQVALATVVSTWGSSPRPPGSHLVVDTNGHFVGSVSGGCIEGAVIQEARQSLIDGQIRLLDFGVSDEQAWEVGLACGGRVQVLVQPLPCHMQLVVDSIAVRQSVATVTNISDCGEGFWKEGEICGNISLTTVEEDEIKEALRAQKTGLLSCNENIFICSYTPAPRLLIVGAVHIAQALIPMATMAGFNVILIDPRRAFANEYRFPNTYLIHEWPDESIARLSPDAMTAVVTLTHDEKLDDPAIFAALRTNAFYIGALGSMRTHAKRLIRLKELGVIDSDLDRIHAPIGLDLGGRMPAEIAVSILSEIIQKRYKRLT